MDNQQNIPTAQPSVQKSNGKMLMGILALMVLVLAISTLFWGYQYTQSNSDLDEAKSELDAKTAELDAARSKLNDYTEAFGADPGEIDSLLSGINVRAKDTERRVDINSLATQLEVYYADNGGYPDGTTENYELNTTTFPGLDIEALKDPSGNTVTVGVDPDSASNNGYYYNPSDCSNGLCASFELGSMLEQDGAGLYKKNSLN